MESMNKEAAKEGAKVLVVDDEPNITELVAMALRYEGFSVKTAATGRGALSAVSQFDPATGLPATTRWRTASVAAGTCVDANIASTAALVMGESAQRWLEANGLPARLVDVEGRVSRFAGWPEPKNLGSAPRIL